LVQLQTNLSRIEATGGRVVAVSYDSPAVLKRFALDRVITFPLLADPGSKTIDAYGIRNKEAPARWDGIPHPGTFIIDRQGVIRAKLFLDSYRERHPAEAVIEALKAVR
jgi:peroxiredoxin